MNLKGYLNMFLLRSHLGHSLIDSSCTCKTNRSCSADAHGHERRVCAACHGSGRIIVGHRSICMSWWRLQRSAEVVAEVAILH